MKNSKPTISEWNVVIHLRIAALTFILVAVFSGIAFGWTHYKNDEVYDTYTEEDAVHGGTMRVAWTNAPRSFDPHVETAAQTTVVGNICYNGLLRLGQRMGEIELDAAESWREIDDTTYEFKLRKGIYFHDIPPVNGREMTSEDVKYSIERMMGKYPAKGLKWQHNYYFKDKLEYIKTPDKYTIVFKTKEPYAPFIRYIASAWTKIVPREAVEEWGHLKTKVAGTGPFMLKEHVKGSHMTFVKHPKYFRKGRPYLDAYHAKFIGSIQSQLSAFIAGKLDFHAAYPWQIKTLQEKAPDSVFYEWPGCYMWIVRFPPWIEGKKPLKPPFGDKRVRHAVAHAIDKERLLKLAWFGAGETAVGAVPPPYTPWSLSQEDQWEYNPEKAKELLAEAGYPDGFSAEMMTWNAPYMTKPMQVIQQMLKEVGIEVKLNPLEFAQYFNKAYSYEYDSMALHITTAGYDPEEWLVPYYGKLETSTYYKWSNRELWDMIDEQAHIMDQQKRETYIHEIQRKVIDEACQLSMYTQTRYWALKPYVHGKPYFHPGSMGLLEFTWMEKH